MKSKAAKKKAMPAKKTAGNEGAWKAIKRLEVIKTSLIHHEDGGHELKDADLLDRIISASLAKRETGSETSVNLVVKVVHVNDRGERIEPTEEERKLDRRIEGKHED